MIDKTVPEYKPSDRHDELRRTVEREFQDALELKTRGYRHLRELSVQDFMERSRDHYNGYVQPRSEESDDWTANYFKKKTRSKVISTVAGYVANGNGIDIGALDPSENIDRAVSDVVDDIFEWSLEREQFDRKLLSAVMEMVVTGTVHIQEEIVWDKRMVKEITAMNFDTGEIEYEEKERVDFKGCRSTFVPNAEMYPGDVWTQDIQDQPYLIRRQQTTYESASVTYSKHSNWKHVQAGSDHFFSADSDQTVSEERSTDSDENAAEVIHRWNKYKDEYTVIVNGIVIIDMPFPYPHKMYPFAKSIFEPFANQDFYWGDSLPNKNWDDQEMVNELHNMFHDSTRLKNKPPLFTTNGELGHTDLIVPGGIGTMQPEDTITTIRELTQGVSNSEFNWLANVEAQMDDNSQQSVTQSQIQDASLATEIRAMVGSSERIREFNQKFLGDLLIQQAHLRIPNLLWFLTTDDEYKKVVRDDVKVKGQNGSRIISFVHAAEIPSPEDIYQAEGTAKQFDANLQIIYVDKDKVNDYRYFITISAIKKPTRTSASRLSRAFAKYNIYLNNPNIDQIKNTEELLEQLGDDPKSWIAQTPPQQQAQPKKSTNADTQLLANATKEESQQLV